MPPLRGTANTITDPDGTVWSIGDKVHVEPSPNALEREREPFDSEIYGIFPGSFDPKAEDTDTAWFSLLNGWMVRPWLCRKL